MSKTLYRDWIVANALGELVGLGGTFALAAWAFSALGEAQSAGAVLQAFAVSVLSGVLEATVVGWAQWRVLRQALPRLGLGAWWRGTLVGALLAYVLGYLPSTLMSLGEQTAGAAPMAEPPQAVVLLLAAGLGLVGGAVLSFAQVLALRGHVRRPGRWVPANMLAWAAGMPLIFAGMDLAMRGRPLGETLAILAVTLLLSGAVVGAIHGRWVVRFGEESQRS